MFLALRVAPYKEGFEIEAVLVLLIYQLSDFTSGHTAPKVFVR
jgi:hypothetical protein